MNKPFRDTDYSDRLPKKEEYRYPFCPNRNHLHFCDERCYDDAKRELDKFLDNFLK